MVWHVRCSDPACSDGTWVRNIVDLLSNHVPDGRGLFTCGLCHRASGYVEKSFALQEQGEVWEPFLRGAIRLADDRSAIYQPFVFLVSYERDGPISDCWFSYYKDTRGRLGGRLKLGYGPGGPPVLGHGQTIDLIRSLLVMGYVSRDELKSLI